MWCAVLLCTTGSWSSFSFIHFLRMKFIHANNSYKQFSLHIVCDRITPRVCNCQRVCTSSLRLKSRFPLKRENHMVVSCAQLWIWRISNSSPLKLAEQITSEINVRRLEKKNNTQLQTHAKCPRISQLSEMKISLESAKSKKKIRSFFLRQELRVATMSTRVTTNEHIDFQPPSKLTTLQRLSIHF